MKRDSFLPDIHRQLPQSIDAEKGVLCSCLLSPQKVIAEAASHLTWESFYQQSHQVIFRELCAMHDAGKPIDFITLTQSLKDKGELDHAGGAADISDLFIFVSTASNSDYYIDITREKAFLRNLIQTCTSLTANAYEEQGDVSFIQDEACKALLNLSEQGKRKQRRGVKEIVKSYTSKVIEQDFDSVEGISTGFNKMDLADAFLREGGMVVVAGPTGGGKSSFVRTIVNSVCVDRKLPSFIASGELSEEEEVQILMNIRSRVEVKKLLHRKSNQSEINKWERAATEVSKSPLHVWGDDYGPINIREIYAHARRLKATTGLRLVVIDTDELIEVETRRGANTEQSLTLISKMAKQMAGELRITVILISQVTTDQKTGRRTLRNAQGKANDASSVWTVDMEDKEGEMVISGNIWVQKSRFGNGGKIPFRFYKTQNRFEDI